MNTVEEKKKENGLPEELTKPDKEGGELTDEIAEEVTGGNYPFAFRPACPPPEPPEML